MALQHLRSSTADKRPTPGAMSDGQLALNTNLVSPGLFFKDSNGDSVKIGPVHVGTTAPNVTPGAGGQAGNSKGEQWLDTSSSRYVFKIWDGTAWRSEDGEFVNASGDTMTGALGIIAGTAAAPGVFFSGDTDTGIYSPGADTLAFVEGGVEAMRIDSSARLLVGTSSAIATGTVTPLLEVASVGSEGATGTTAAVMAFNTAGTDPARFVLAKSLSSTQGGHVALTSGADIGIIRFMGSDGTQFQDGATILSEADGAWASGDCPGRLVFSTTADGAPGASTERMRINSDGNVLVGVTDTTVMNTGGIVLNPVGFVDSSRNGSIAARFGRFNSNGNVVAFVRDATQVGVISVTTTATSYVTSSDYRLKENVVDLEGAIARLNQLPVHRFNFIADPDTVVDGFIAHEVQDIVPEAITGTKDEVDDDGNPVMQGIDQSKLVPLLTAALQESIAKIEQLEQRLAAAGIA